MPGQKAGIRLLVFGLVWSVTTAGSVSQGPATCHTWPPPCSQVCQSNTSLPGDVHCACMSGYHLLSDGSRCQAEGGRPEVLVSSGPEVLLLIPNGDDDRSSPKTATWQYRTVYHGGHIDIRSMAYDHLSRVIFWTEETSSQVHTTRFSMGGGTDTPIPQQRQVLIGYGVMRPSVMTVDWLGRHLYLADVTRILACRLDGSMCVVVVSDREGDISAIFLLPPRGLMFWSECQSTTGAIYVSRLNGDHIEKVATGKLGCLKSLTYDLSLHAIYWIETTKTSRLIKFMRLDIDGEPVHTLSNKLIRSPSSLAVFEDEVFFTASSANGRGSMSLKSVHKRSEASHRDTPRTLLAGIIQQPATIVIQHSVLQLPVYNPCMETPCSHMCLIKDAGIHVCACPGRMQLDVHNNSSCLYPSNITYLVLARGPSLYRVDTAWIGHNLLSDLSLSLPSDVTSAATHMNRQLLLVSSAHAIYRVELTSWTCTTIITLDNTSDIRQLEIDSVSDNFYWFDASTGALHMASLDGSSSVLLKGFVDNLSGFTVDPMRGVLYIADCGVKSRILVCDMTGAHCFVLTSVTSCPRHMVVTDAVDELLFVDDTAQNVWKLSMGLEPQMTHLGFGTDITGLACMEGVVYWSDAHTEQLDAISVDGRGARRSLPLSITDAAVVVAVHQVRTPANVSGCRNAGCSHLCVMSSEELTCLCPDHMVLSTDDLTCQNTVGLNSTDEVFERETGCDPSCPPNGVCRKLDGEAECYCGDSVRDERCGNNTQTDVTYSLLGRNNYVWIAGVLGLFVVTILLVLTVFYCIRRKKAHNEQANVSVICFKEALLGPAAGATDSTHCLVSMEHPQLTETGGDGSVRFSPSEESLHVIPPGLDSPRYPHKQSQYKTDFHRLVESPFHHSEST